MASDKGTIGPGILIAILVLLIVGVTYSVGVVRKAVAAPVEGQMSEATPDVIAAVRGRFPDLQGDRVNVLDGVVDFYTTHWHVACQLTLNPIRIIHCHSVHA